MEGETSKTYMFGGDGGYLPLLVSMFNQRGIDPSVLYAMNNNGNLNGNEFIWILFLLMFCGNGNFFGRGNNGNDFLSSQINNTAGRDLLLQGIQGNANAIGQLASTLSADFNAVQSGITSLLSATQGVGSQVGMTGLQTINAIQAGNSSLSAQLAQCCCDNRLLTTQQGYESRIATIEQTNQLGSQADRNTRTLADQIAAQTVAMNDGFCQIKERELQGKIDTLLAENTSLKTALSEGRQTQQFTAAFNILDNKITELAAKQPQTVPVQWPQITAVNTTPNFGPSWGAGFNPYGYGWGGQSYWG